MTNLKVPRLNLAPPPRFGPIDGAWWPYGRSADGELRALVAALDGVLPQPVTRVNVQLGGWDDIPRKLNVGGREVRVGWFRSGDPHLITVTTTRHATIQLLVIPAHTTPAMASIALAIAASGTNTAHPVTILDTSRSIAETHRAADQDRSLPEAELDWDNEGGSPVLRA